MKKINSETEFKEAIEGIDCSVLKVGAPWCSPCRVLESTIAEIEKENIDSANFVEVDVEDADEDFVASLGVRNIPVLIYYKNGEQVDKTVGLLTKDQLLAKITEIKEK